MKKTFFLVSLVALLSLASISFAVTELSMQSSYNLNHVTHEKFFNNWIKLVEEKSKGSLVINSFATGAIVAGAETYKSVKSGMLDMAIWMPTGAASKDCPYWQVGSLPFLAKSSEHATKILWQYYNENPDAKKELENIGVPFLLWSSTITGVFSLKDPIVSPKDFVGKRILCVSPIEIENVRAFGGVPVQVAPTDVYVGLQRGMGDALYTAIPMATSLRIMEIAKYVTILPTYVSPTIMSMNRELYDSLSAEEQDAFNVIAPIEASLSVAKVLDDDARNGIKQFEDAGIKVTKLTDAQFTEFENTLANFIQVDWVEKLNDLGVKDSKALVDKMYAISDSIPADNLIK